MFDTDDVRRRARPGRAAEDVGDVRSARDDTPAAVDQAREPRPARTCRPRRAGGCATPACAATPSRAGTACGPGQTLTRARRLGTARASDLLLGPRRDDLRELDDGGDAGDGAYVFDPQGDLRDVVDLSMPCRVHRSHQGAVRVVAHPAGPSTRWSATCQAAPVDLYGYELFFGGGNYAFPPGSVLPAGRTMTVDVAGSPSQDTAPRQARGDRRALPARPRRRGRATDLRGDRARRAPPGATAAAERARVLPFSARRRGAARRGSRRRARRGSTAYSSRSMRRAERRSSCAVRSSMSRRTARAGRVRPPGYRPADDSPGAFSTSV